MGVKVFEKVSGIWSISLIGVGILLFIIIEGKVESIDLGVGWCIELMIGR